MTRRVRERPRMSTPRAFQEKGCWKMRWPRSPAKKSALGRPPPKRGEEAKMGDADVLRLVHDREVERRLLALRDRGRQRA